MSKVFITVFVFYTDLQTSCLCIGQVGAAAYLKIFLLSGRPCFHVYGFHLQISQIAGAAFQSSYGDIQRAEQVYGVLPQLVKPHSTFLGFADNDHLLFFELVNTVNALFFNAVSAFFLTETGGIAGQGVGQILFGKNGIDELTDHGMFTGTDQVQIFSFDFVHHGIHFIKAHNACNDIAADHERRYAVGKSAVDHEISCIGDHSRVKSGNIAHQIVETVAGYLSGAVQIDAVEFFHNLGVVGDFEVGNNRFTVFLNFHILGIVFTDGYRRIDDIGNGHHDLCDLFFQFGLCAFQLGQTGSISSNLCFYFLSFFFFALFHQTADLFGQSIFFRS